MSTPPRDQRRDQRFPRETDASGVDKGINFPRCIAYLESGRICGQGATIFDARRGGMVCHQHAPQPEPEKKAA